MKTNTKKVSQVFSFRSPAAASVLLAGDFTNWQEDAIPLKPQGKGLWSIAIKLSPGTHHYRFIVDGEWQDDPECAVRAPNPFGTQNALRIVAAAV